MNSFVNQTIASYSNCMIITEGQTFAFVSGLAGTKIYDQKVHGPGGQGFINKMKYKYDGINNQ